MQPTPVTLTPIFHEKIWGTTRIEPWFPPQGKKIGEVWFQSEGFHLPLLVKFIFTSERLSVQVHPDDQYASAHGLTAGKTEMWHILRSEPGAVIALGFRREVDKETIREASRSNQVEELLNWIRVEPGDTYFVKAGRVHAIGAGIALCEIQQMSDITYRLYDYGRPRELHLDRALEVVLTSAGFEKREPEPITARETRLVSSSHFITERLHLEEPYLCLPSPICSQILVCTRGSGFLNEAYFHAGMAWFVPKGCASFLLQPQGETELLRSFSPPSE